ncbi:MAG: hypothetical protein ABIS07_11300 [Dokdonella sp.]
MRSVAATFVLACSVVADANAQDLSVVAIEAPQSACAPVGIENVTIRVFNYGPTLPAGSAFNASYTINAGAPVTELVVLGSSLLPNSNLAYTFTTQANLSVPASYTFNATVTLSGDSNPFNDAYIGWNVTTSAASDGGTAAGPGAPVLAGTVTLTGQIGEILEWQQSEDGGARWRRLANAGATLPFAMLYRDTVFRARAGNGLCAPVLSNAVLVVSSDPIFHSGFEP